jgi:hypothetical protein
MLIITGDPGHLTQERQQDTHAVIKTFQNKETDEQNSDKNKPKGIKSIILSSYLGSGGTPLGTSTGVTAPDPCLANLMSRYNGRHQDAVKHGKADQREKNHPKGNIGRDGVGGFCAKNDPGWRPNR